MDLSPGRDCLRLKIVTYRNRKRIRARAQFSSDSHGATRATWCSTVSLRVLEVSGWRSGGRRPDTFSTVSATGDRNITGSDVRAPLLQNRICPRVKAWQVQMCCRAVGGFPGRRPRPRGNLRFLALGCCRSSRAETGRAGREGTHGWQMFRVRCRRVDARNIIR